MYLQSMNLQGEICMGARRVRRGPRRRDELREEGELRLKRYDSLSLRDKIRLQLRDGHDGRQLQKLYSRLEVKEATG